MIHKLIDAAHVVLQLLTFKVYGNFGISKMNASFLPGMTRLIHGLLYIQIITSFQLPLFKHSKFRDCGGLKFLEKSVQTLF